jgi:hypothetical protein
MPIVLRKARRFSMLALGFLLALSTRSVAQNTLTDVHFHHCSFSHACVPLDRMADEMDKAGVATAWIFGLQHQLRPNPGTLEDWPATNRCTLATPMTHPGDPDIDTCKQIHAALVQQGKRPFHYNDACANPGWPVAPNSQADETILSQYASLPPEKQQRLKPFLSYLNFDAPCARNAAGENMNLAYVKAMDRKYPRMIFGFAEHNLNKQALFTHDACRPD